MRYDLNSADEVAQALNTIRDSEEDAIEPLTVKRLQEIISIESAKLAGGERVRVLNIDDPPCRMTEDNVSCFRFSSQKRG